MNIKIVFYYRLMEDIFSFQKIYLLTNNYDIIDFKKIEEINKTYENLHNLKKIFYKKVINNIKDKDCILSIKEFILKYKIYIYNNIYTYISNFNNKYIDENIIEYNFIREIYNLKLSDTIILKKIYDKEIIIRNEQYLAYLFIKHNIYLKKYKCIDIYKFYFKNINVSEEKIIKNIEEIGSRFNYIKTIKVFDFYKKTLLYKKYDDDDLIYYLLLNDYELNIDKIAKLYNIQNIKNKFKNMTKLYSFYFTNFSKFNYIISENLFLKIYQKFDLLFFKSIYNKLLIQNKINLSNTLDIYNFYFKNNELLINIDQFNNKYTNIEQKFIQYVYLNNNDNLYSYVNYVINNSNIILNLEDFISNFSDFNMSMYLKNNKNNKIKNNYDIVKELIINKTNIIYKLPKSRKIYTDFINKYYNYKNINENDIRLLSINSIDNKLILNLEEYEKKYNINIKFIKLFNNLLSNKDYQYIIYKLINNDNYHDNKDNNKDDIIINYNNLKNKYINLLNNINVDKDEEYLNKINNINSNEELITFFTKDVYHLKCNKNSIGRKNVYMIEEVLIDFDLHRPKLMDGISLIIRAKNEEKNVKLCIESVIDLVDEIIFVNNGSTDNTLKIIETLAEKYNKIKIYNYFINVNRVGKEHEIAIKNGDNNTLSNFYNWCLNKSTMKHVIKWDADFICIRNNFRSMVDNLKIKN